MAQRRPINVSLMSPSTSPFAPTPRPPYFAVIFTSLRTREDEGYGRASERMVELAAQQPGFLGVESVRGADGFGITVSYWASLESIASWKRDEEHRAAQDSGRRLWYAEYQVRIVEVTRDYGTL
jgi:heme-degrading monooxygenase HmoA